MKYSMTKAHITYKINLPYIHINRIFYYLLSCKLLLREHLLLHYNILETQFRARNFSPSDTSALT